MAETSDTAVQRVLSALCTQHFAEFRCGGETYLIQPENNKGWDYISIWRTGAAAACLDRAFFELRDGIDEDTVRELLSMPCICGQSFLQCQERGAVEWL